MYDIIIIGAGPAGISAGIYAVSRGQRTLVLEKAGGRHYRQGFYRHALHRPGSAGNRNHLAARMKEQALAAGVEIVYANVTGVALAGETKTVTTDKGTYEARRVILPTAAHRENWASPARANWPEKAWG